MKILTDHILLQMSIRLTCSCTLGMFDGVHRGHLFLLDELQKRAKANDTPTLVISFSSHPAEALRGVTEDFLLSTTDERLQHLQNTNVVDYLYLISPDVSLWSLDQKEFLERKVYPFFDIKTFLIGHDSRFGKNRQGDFAFLQTEAREKKYKVEEIGAIYTEDQKNKISSTNIRKALKENQVAEANDMLGYAYSFRGVVVKGDQRGRTIGFPTANLLLNDSRKLIPQNGVYAVTLNIRTSKYKDKEFQGVMNIGVRPTFHVGERKVIEVHILDFSDDIYDSEMEVNVHHFLRVEQKFESVNHLIKQLGEDKNSARTFFSETKF